MSIDSCSTLEQRHPSLLFYFALWRDIQNVSIAVFSPFFVFSLLHFLTCCFTRQTALPTSCCCLLSQGVFISFLSMDPYLFNNTCPVIFQKNIYFYHCSDSPTQSPPLVLKGLLSYKGLCKNKISLLTLTTVLPCLSLCSSWGGPSYSCAIWQ